MNKVLHPRDDIDRLYKSRNAGERGLASTEGNVNASIQRHEDCIKKHKERLHYSHQKQYKHQQNDNKEKTKTRRKTTVWIFQATNKQNLTQENVDTTKKEKP